MDAANGTSRAGKGPGATSTPRAANGISGLNGVGGINGVKPIKGRALGGPQQRRVKAARRPGVFAWLFSVAARLFTWYTILTILFRCPATLDACDETTPGLCKPYFQLKHAVAPHLEPYYDTYAAPYVELVRPYYHTIDERVLTPGWRYAKQHGAPRVEQLQALGATQWEKTVQPQVEKYQVLARAQYDEWLAPHLDRVSTALGPYYENVWTNGLQTYHERLVPAYQYVQPQLAEGYRTASVFTSETVVPAFVWTWNKTYVFLDGTVGPQVKAIYVENVEPQLHKIGKRLGRYSSGKKSVPKPPAEFSSSASTETSSSFTKPAASVTSASASGSSSTSAASSASASGSSSSSSSTESKKDRNSGRPRSTLEPVPPPEVDENLEREEPGRKETREIVAADLRDWQERYAKAADEAASEIDDRVQEIAKRMIRRNARITGQSHLEQLRTTTVSALVSLRRDILEVITAAKSDAVTSEQAQEQIVQLVRRAGMAVKEKGQAVRQWREDYEREMQTSITQAAETHFTILENIRDLALQKIGMKWAWTDGITYKDWQKYHLLKSRFDEWKLDLQQHVTSHPTLEAAQIEAATIEDDAMDAAAAAARELARLKQVAGWKLTAGDDSAEFDSTLMQQAAEAVEAARQVVQAAGDAVAEGFAEGAGIVSEAVLGTAEAESEQTEGVSTEASVEEPETSPTDAPEPEEVAKTEVSEPVPESEETEGVNAHQTEPEAETQLEAETETETETAEPVVGTTEEFTAEAENQFETPVIVSNVTAAEPETEREEEPAPEELVHNEDAKETSHDGEDAEATISQDEEVETHPDKEELGTETSQDEVDETEAYEGLPVSETATVKPALFGAAAQAVPNRQPILDDTFDDVSAAVESMRDDLKSAYTSAMSLANEQYSHALSIVSAQIHGTPQPAHEKLLASVTAAYSNAMASASARLDVAIQAASDQLYGTTTKPTTTNNILPTTIPVPDIPTVDWAHIESIAAERLQQGRAWAEEQYESAKRAIGLATEPTPTPSTPAEHVHKLLDNARHNYYAALGVAHERYSDFLAGASSALHSVTAPSTQPTPSDVIGSASSLASVANASAASAAAAISEGASAALSSAADNASSVVSAASGNAASVASAASENASSLAAAGYDSASAASDQIAETWEVIVSRVSIQVYGAPTPTAWYAGLSSALDGYAFAADDTRSTVTEAVGTYVSAGSEEVARQYSAVSSILSEALVGVSKEPSFSESVLEKVRGVLAYPTGGAWEAAGNVVGRVEEGVSEAGEKVKSAGEKVRSVVRDEL
ncbi:hypothetical protein B0J18DRAFT_462813 [Chaetomium sp. MPI-SDFR-AT-0129]|nr:hypothetical protein B0J18DRAFT_462813 [Chaetomium sp. MPI-SDFR-AT-0129]